MGGLSVTNCERIFNQLNRCVKEVKKNGSPVLYLTSSAHFPDGFHLKAQLDFDAPFYRIIMSVGSSNINKFSGFDTRLMSQFKIRDLPWFYQKNDANSGYIKRKGSPALDYYVTFEKPENQGFLTISCGDEGTTPRSISNSRVFHENIGELEQLSNLLFYPFMKGNLSARNMPLYELPFAF
jgi:hypothetical protein